MQRPMKNWNSKVKLCSYVLRPWHPLVFCFNPNPNDSQTAWGTNMTNWGETLWIIITNWELLPR